MRISRYTFACDSVAGEHLLYNTAYGTFAALDDEAFAAFRACEGPLAKRMLDDNLLTELTPEEELAAQQTMFQAAREDPSALYLSIAPTYACNFRCPYCYEQGHNGVKGKMGADVMEAVCRFAQARFDERPFTELQVQWYGGDPSLALDVVEELSRKLIGWCDGCGVAYEAMMLSNCNNIDDDAARMLAHARVKLVYMTIDGFEETHNARRVSATGSNSFERNIEAARLFARHGIKVKATMNVDRVNCLNSIPRAISCAPSWESSFRVHACAIMAISSGRAISRNRRSTCSTTPSTRASNTTNSPQAASRARTSATC